MTALVEKSHLATLRRGRQRQASGGSSLLSLPLALLVIVGALLLPSAHSFCSVRLAASPFSRSLSVVRAFRSDENDEEPFGVNNNNNNNNNNIRASKTRRGVLSRAATAASAWCFLATGSLSLGPSKALAAPEDDVQETRALIEQAKTQLETVPSLVKDEKWDGVRAILMEAPLRDCWSKSTPILKKYAEALGETPKGDELAALEGREELLQHLRFLDMAVYNNVFNPISSEGTTGASKALIDSYYNDPTREYEASKKAIEDLLQLSSK